MRIGAHLNIDIEHSDWVYVHRGALVGWQNLLMPHYMIEDFFCEYRLWLHPELLVREVA